MINEPLVYFKSESSFNNKKNQLIDASANNQVVFIGTTDKTQTGKIYTHGQFFGGTSSIDPETLDLSNYIKNTDNLLKINNVWYKKGDSVTVSGGNGVSTLAELTDTNINNPQDADLLVYMDGKWTNRTIGGGGDDPIVLPPYKPYDDSWINDELLNLDDKIEQAKTRLNNIHEWSENEVNTTATNAIKNMAWYASLIDENGQINWEGNLDRLLGVGVITENSGAWSLLRQKVDTDHNNLATLDAEVANLVLGTVDEEHVATLVASKLNLSADEKEAIAKLESMWTTGEVNDDDDFQAAKWFLSAYRNYASQNKTFSEVISDAADEAVGSATAGLVTEVELTNKGYVSRTELASTVHDEVGNQISTSGFITENTLGDAFASMFAQNGKAKAAVLNHVTSEINKNGSEIRTAIAGLVADSGDGGNAGVYVKNTELGEKTVEILTNNANAKAQIVATVNDDNSEIQISADKIIFSNNPDEKTVAMAISKNQVAISDLAATKATITQLNATNALINNLSSTYATIANLNATNARIDNLIAGKVDTNKLHTFNGLTVNGDGFHVVIENGEIIGYKKENNEISEYSYNMSNTGSGYFAGGKISWLADGSGYIGGQNEFSWDSNGNVKIKDLTVDQLKAKVMAIDKLDVESLNAAKAKIDELDVDTLNAKVANIDTLTADVATINGQLTAASADIADLKADRLKAKEVHSYSGSGEGSSGKHVVIKDGNLNCYYNDSSGNRTSGFTVDYDGTVSITKRYAADASAVDTMYLTEIAVKDITALVSKSNGKVFVLPNGTDPYVVNGGNATSSVISQYVYVNTADTSVHASSFPTTSDRNLKDIAEDTTLTVEQVAEAPAVNFTWKSDADKEDKKEHVGTIAQYWQVVLPQVVTEDESGILSMEYSNAALVSSIVTAKEVVALKEQVAELQRRIDELKNI